MLPCGDGGADPPRPNSCVAPMAIKSTSAVRPTADSVVFPALLVRTWVIRLLFRLLPCGRRVTSPLTLQQRDANFSRKQIWNSVQKAASAGLTAPSTCLRFRQVHAAARPRAARARHGSVRDRQLF